MAIIWVEGELKAGSLSRGPKPLYRRGQMAVLTLLVVAGWETTASVHVMGVVTIGFADTFYVGCEGAGGLSCF